MDYLQLFKRQFQERLIGLLVINNVILLADWWIADQIFKLAGYWLLVALLIVPILSITILPWVSTKYLTQPTKLIWQAILHTLPDSHNVPAPQLESAGLGRELVTHLANSVYQLAIDGARLAAQSDEEANDLHHNPVAVKLPLPLLVLDTASTIRYANPAAIRFLEANEQDVIGKNVAELLSLSFPDEDTLAGWLHKSSQNSVSATSTWQRVRTTLPTKKTLQFDLAASYSKDDPHGNEVILTMFDRTATYEQDDQSLSFIALAVHELRTPLSLLLGYIELFEEELGDKLDPEMKRFMQQMKTAGQNLSAFVSNVLTVARIENNQLELQLTEQQWGPIVKQAVEEMRLRAQVQGINLEVSIADGLPTVGANPITASEVLINLIDNAIKYSKNTAGKKIIIKTQLNAQGLIETTIQDFGVGIPGNVIPNLFEKFYRNHRTRMQVGGTGLGLYLCRQIVEAHGGQIWVQSQDGQGTTFGFTVKPYTMLASELKNGNNTDIIHSAHGWIKNHTLYRS